MLAAISEMQKASLPETYQPFLGRSAVERFIAAGSVECYFEGHWHQSIVATVDAEIVGVAVLCFSGELIDLVWVKPSFRSRGIGAALMSQAERLAGGSGELTLHVWSVNQRAVAFYERVGFSVREEMKDPATGLDELVMRKSLEQNS
jgi:ribosomal protein S18 acetylase RimI-like enzyme